jgi:aminoglycoside phosphotransferase family enzyme
MKKLKCFHCGGDCCHGMICLEDGSIICVDCIYEYLGGDNDHGHDWKFSVMTAAAWQIREKNRKKNL